jgi:hypothetical protein
LLLVLERELDIYARGERPDYEVVHAVIFFFPAAINALEPAD